jgi:hypothetical protein
MAQDSEEKAAPKEEAITLQDFLASFGPNKLFPVQNLGRRTREGFRPEYNSNDIELYCDSERCQGVRAFECVSSMFELTAGDEFKFKFVDYRCRNCRQTRKRYAIAVRGEESSGEAIGFTKGDAYKLGEFPVFGPPTPPRMLRLIQKDRELFLIGRRAETQGMGIGAFAYYRRVVEAHKTRIFDRIIDVAKKLGGKDEAIAKLEKDRDQWSFEASAEALKDIMPGELFVDGQNPLLLLHRALSANLHERSDKECLELAETIRLVLIEFADRCAEILKDRNELTAAVRRLGAA